ncbi:MAG TPA: cupin domain-containing protein [Usitatibacter sp.]|nr:cupin domain-containing protein [Usitatibacter sp.]
MTVNDLLKLDRAAFMRDYWQRKPLLIRGAFPRFADPLSPREVLRLAANEDAVSRLVIRNGKRWSVEHGPLPASRFKQLPRRDWTVLVQDTNHFSRAARELLARFDFIPHARIDDVMVSYAVPGGGVGPHVDSYDVFLLQGHGRRRWTISRQKDLAFVPGLDLKILARFKPGTEWVLEPGDMLYLPPGVAHHGVAETECLTWSIGFRAPADQELAQGFLDFLRDRLAPSGHYRDPGERPARHPGAIPPRWMRHAAHAVRSIRWSDRDIRAFAGRFLSEPKTHVFFTPPSRPLPRPQFERRASRSGVELDPRSRLVFSGTMFFLNGDEVRVPATARGFMRRLADAGRIEGPVSAPRAFWEAAHGWYLRGFLKIGEAR